MGWEVRNYQFFCNTSDSFFGPYLDESIWPDPDTWPTSDRDKLFYVLFNNFLQNNPQKRSGRVETDPRGMTKSYLEKIVGLFENQWLNLDSAAEYLVYTAKDNQMDARWILSQMSGDLDFTTNKPTKVKRSVNKKKKCNTPTRRGAQTKKKPAKKKPAKKKMRISSWHRYEFVGGNSSKFWEVKKIGKKYSVRYGRIGSAGRTVDTQMNSSNEAALKVSNMIDAKLKKGYAFAKSGRLI
jgi:predicted DNA-binding WGR domain protein